MPMPERLLSAIVALVIMTSIAAALALTLHPRVARGGDLHPSMTRRAGNTVFFYGPNGSLQGYSRRFGDNLHVYGPDGSYLGSARGFGDDAIIVDQDGHSVGAVRQTPSGTVLYDQNGPVGATREGLDAAMLDDPPADGDASDLATPDLSKTPRDLPYLALPPPAEGAVGPPPGTNLFGGVGNPAPR